MLVDFSKSLVNKINEPLDNTLIRKNYSGEKYITGYTVVRMLNSVTNGAWSWNVDKTWTEEFDDKKGHHTVYHMLGTLTLYFSDGNDGVISIQKQAAAGKELQPSIKNAENIYKSIGTLALRKAASYAGIGAELWLNEDETEYFEMAGLEPVWNDALKKQYSAQWKFIEDTSNEYEIDESTWNSLAADYGYPGVDYIPVDKFDGFIEHIKTLMAGQEEA